MVPDNFVSHISWRIDQQEMSSFIGQMRNHISNMILGVNSAAEPHAGTAVVSPHHPTDSVTPQESNNLSLPPPPLPRPYRRKRRLKDLIVDLAVPQFDDPGTLLPYSSQLEVFERNLNVDQRAALRRYKENSLSCVGVIIVCSVQRAHCARLLPASWNARHWENIDVRACNLRTTACKLPRTDMFNCKWL